MKRGSFKISEYSLVEASLRSILQPYEKDMMVLSPEGMDFGLNTRHIMPNKQPLFFAGVKQRKNYVSFYLMPVYVFPELLNGISDNLRKRMQGKSCFNFTKVDPVLFAELDALTQAGFIRYREKGYIE